MKKARIIVCPHCDEELAVGLERMEVKCRGCKEIFEVKEEKSRHPHHFWHNPENSFGF